MNGDIKPITKRGFFCDDSSINYPHNKETVGLAMLMFVALVVPGLVIKFCDTSFNRLLKNSPHQHIAFELGTIRKRRKVSDDNQELDAEEEELISSPDTIKRRNLDSTNESDLNISDPDKINGTGSEDDEVNLFTRVPLDSDSEQNSDKARRSSQITAKLFSRSYGEFHLFFFGFSTTMLFTGIGKITCGRLRPHFIQRCQPNVDCSTAANSNKYIEEFACTNDQLRSRDFSYITTSWPSGKSWQYNHLNPKFMLHTMLTKMPYISTIESYVTQVMHQSCSIP